MNQRVINLELEAHLNAIEGDGSELIFLVKGFRTTKAGTPERYELKLKACRYAVKCLLAEIRKMHVRDRERLVRESARIDEEIGSLRP